MLHPRPINVQDNPFEHVIQAPKATLDAGTGPREMIFTTQYFNIGDGVHSSAATADYEGRAERQHNLADDAERQAELRTHEQLQIARQQAPELLLDADRRMREQRQSDQAEAINAINYVKQKAERVMQENTKHSKQRHIITLTRLSTKAEGLLIRNDGKDMRCNNKRN